MFRCRSLFFSAIALTLFRSAPTAGFQSASQPTSRPARDQPILKVEQSAVELGAGWSGTTVKAGFIVQNLGPLPLEITAVRTGPGCELDPATPRRIDPKSKIDVKVLAVVPFVDGSYTKLVTLDTNDPVTPTITLKVKGIARPAIEVQPAQAGFGKIDAGQPKELVVTLTNHLDEPVKLELEKIEHKKFDFELVETKPGEEYQVKIRLKPPLDPGRRQETVNLTTGLAIQPNIPIQATAYLSPRIEINPNVIRLGPPNPKAETKKVLLLSNNSDKPIRVIEAKSTDPAIQLNITDIIKGRDYRILVTMPMGYDPGPKPQIITLHTDDPRQPTVEVAVIGPLVPTSPAAGGGIPIPIDQLVGRPAPKFELTTIEGKGVNNLATKGKFLALLFFTSHNFDNSEALKKVEELRRMFEPRGVRFINVAEQGPSPGPTFSQEQMVDSLKMIDAKAELCIDLANIVADNFHLMIYPTLVVIGKTGEIEFIQVGNAPDYVASVKARFEALIGPTMKIVKPAAAAGPTPEQIQRRPALGMIGLSVPSFSIQTLDAKPVGDAEMQNAPATVLNFVAPNCGFCRRQLPMVESVRADYEKRGVRFVNISQTMKKKYSNEEAAKTIHTIGNHSELANDPDNKIGDLFRVTSFPTTAVVRRDGRIETVFVGAKKNIDALLRGQLDAILKADVSIKSAE